MPVSRTKNSAGLEIINLNSNSGSSAQISAYGAHVLSYKNSLGRELLYLSSKADLSGKKSIRGGIPLIFPQFGPRTLPNHKSLASHGFARVSNWDVLEIGENANRQPFASFTLNTASSDFNAWNGNFSLLYRVTLSESLRTELTVRNYGEHAFTFQVALHTYFSVNDIPETRVLGLGNRDYLDNADNMNRSHETREIIDLDGFVDRVYLSVPSELKILDGKSNRINLTSYNLPDAVLWNPASIAGAKIADIGTDEYKKFVCLECACIERALILDPEQGMYFSQEISS